MTRRGAGSEPLGVCHRLFTFIMSTVVGRGLRRVTTGRPGTQEPNEGLSTNRDQKQALESTNQNGPVHYSEQPKGSSEIMVEFGHINGPIETWTPIELPQRREIPLVQGNDVLGNGSQTMENNEGGIMREGKKSEDRKEKKKKEEEIESDDSRKRHPRHLLDVVSNINEKSDEFIRKKKEAMRRNISLDPRKP